MIVGWLVYCVVVSALLAVAASVVDAALTARGRPARWIWVAAIAGSIAVPAGAFVLQARAKTPLPGLDETRAGGLIARYPSYALDAAQPVPSLAARVPRLRMPEVLGAERVVVGVVIACILIAALRVAFDSLLLYRGRQQWTAHVVDGEGVLVSDDLGPAIVGLIEPKIVLPRWTLALDPSDRALMLAHEREHVRTNDGRLTTAALLAVVCMPWNPAAWYALRRLRTAIEVDCDRRVLRGFPDVARYGHLLVDVAQRATGSSLAVAGFSERAAPLARRIRAMTATTKPKMFLRDAAGALLGVAALVGAGLILPPVAPARSATRTDVDLPVMARQLADSIVVRDSAFTAIASARDLPREFAVVEFGDEREARAGSCAERLRDDRDGTLLVHRSGRTSVTGRVTRADTTWTRLRSVGYYGVTPAGRYGVNDNQLLRIACGSFTYRTVAGKQSTSNALSTLDTPNDDRARRIADEVGTLIRVKPLAVELFSQRLDVIVGDTLAARSDDARWNVMNALFARARDVLGRSAMPETLTVSFRLGRDRWATLVHYTSMEK